MEILDLIISYDFIIILLAMLICILPVLLDYCFLFYQMCDWNSSEDNND